MKLSEYMSELRGDVQAFENYWLVEHAKDPEQFPLEFGEGNDGIWDEMFLAFISMTEEERGAS